METEQTSENNLRNPGERPIFKLSVKLIDTYKYINKVYYEAKAKKLKEQSDTTRKGVHNDGYDDQNYDYILLGDEIINDRYILKHRMGKGSFGQVVCAYDNVKKCEVAVKIIKSRKPFQVQARTEIDILEKILEKDQNDESNVVRLLDQFMFRNHQCLVFEILSFNLYELLKNTKFRGVSLSLIRKFSKSLLKALEFLSKPDVNIIHCDLKPENILLRHPRRSAIKVIDFGSSCYLNKRTYSYIQSRFYRSPEVILGLPYSQKIDMWSLGCVLVEMHTGEPLFGGSNQADQICRIIDILGMPPLQMIKESPEKARTQFFEKIKVPTEIPTDLTPPATPDNALQLNSVIPPTPPITVADTNIGTNATNATNPAMSLAHAAAMAAITPTLPAICDPSCSVFDEAEGYCYVLKRPNKNLPKQRKLSDVIGVYTGGPNGRRAGDKDHEEERYLEFLDFVSKMLIYNPSERASPSEMLSHRYLHLFESSASFIASNQNNGNVSASITVDPTSSAASAATTTASTITPHGSSTGLNADPLAATMVMQNGISGSEKVAAIATDVDTGNSSEAMEVVPTSGVSNEGATVSSSGTTVASNISSYNVSGTINDGSSAMDVHTASTTIGEGLNVTNSGSSYKDTSRDRRGEAPNVSKIRSQSAPGGTSYGVRLFPANTDTTSNDKQY